MKDLRITAKQNILENHSARSERNIYALGLYSAFLACRAIVFNSSLQSIFTVETIFLPMENNRSESFPSAAKRTFQQLSACINTSTSLLHEGTTNKALAILQAITGHQINPISWIIA
jgi:hypothetical protein